MCKEIIHNDYDPFNEGKVKPDNTKLIVSVLKKTAAVMTGGVTYKVQGKRVKVRSNGCKDFKAVGIMDSLGIFDTYFTCDTDGAILLMIS